MIFIILISVICGWFTGFGTVVEATDLAIDPLSVFLDQGSHRLCWNQINGVIMEANKTIELEKLTSKDKDNYTITFFGNEFKNKTYCIRGRKYGEKYQMKLLMTTDINPIICYLDFRFGFPLVPPLKVIKVRTTSRGIRLEMNNKFVGLESDIPKCQVLWTSKLKSNTKFGFFNLQNEKKINVDMKAGSSFIVYYTCAYQTSFFGSSKFVSLRGTIDPDIVITDLQPIIQMPFRRFIMASWRHDNKSGRQYFIKISRMYPANKEICIKIFRLFINILPNITDLKVERIPNCNTDVPMEDLGYLEIEGSQNITVMLDMIQPLEMYQKHKLTIFWNDSFGPLKNNYIFFDTLPNENSGKLLISDLNKTLSDPPDIYQTDVSTVTDHPNMKLVKYGAPYDRHYLMGSITTKLVHKVIKGTLISEIDAFVNGTTIGKSIFPYYYSIFQNGYFYEIIQLPLSKDKSIQINSLKLVQEDDDIAALTVSWKITGYPFVTAPAMFGIEVSEVRQYESVDCQNAYILKCRTCSNSYMEEIIKWEKEQKSKWERKGCRKLSVENYYDAVVDSIQFQIKDLPKSKFFRAKVISFSYKGTKWELSDKARIKVSKSPTNVNIIIGLLCTTIVVGILIVLYFHFRHTTKTEVTKEKEESNTYEHEDET